MVRSVSLSCVCTRSQEWRWLLCHLVQALQAQKQKIDQLFSANAQCVNERNFCQLFVIPSTKFSQGATDRLFEKFIKCNYEIRRDNNAAFFDIRRVNSSVTFHSEHTPVFGSRLRSARQRLGLAQDKLGVLIGLDEHTASARISRYENGIHEPPVKTAQLLATTLDVPLAYLYCENNRLADLLLMASKLSEDQWTLLDDFTARLCSQLRLLFHTQAPTQVAFQISRTQRIAITY